MSSNEINILENPEQLLIDCHKRATMILEYCDKILQYLKQFMDESIDTKEISGQQDMEAKRKSFMLIANPTISRLVDSYNDSINNIINIYDKIQDYKYKEKELNMRQLLLDGKNVNNNSINEKEKALGILGVQLSKMSEMALTNNEQK